MLTHRIDVGGSPRTSLQPCISSRPTKISLKQKLHSVRVLLLTAFTLQVVIMGAIMYGVIVYSQTRVMDDLSQSVTSEVIGRVGGITKSSFTTTYLTVKGMKYQLPNVTNATLEDIRVAMWKLWLQSAGQLQDIYWRTPRGDWMGYSTPPERDTLQIMYTNVSESPLGYLITVTNMEDGTGQMHNNETTLLKSEHDWFPKAAASRTGEPTWSSVSKDENHKDNKILWLSCALPIWDPVTDVTYGVVAVDITSADLSSELQMLSLSPNTKIWIMDQDGNLIASSDIREQSYGEFHDNLDTAQNSNLELIRETTRLVFARNDSRPNYKFSYELHGETIDAYYHTITDYGLNYSVIVAFPESDFFGVVQKAKTIIVSVGVMHLIRKPLTSLSRQMGFISKGVFDTSSARSHTKLHEISALQDDFDRMLTAIKSFCRFVPVDIVQHLLRNNEEATASMTQKELTVMFSDIKNFTTIVEEMSPSQLSLLLSDYLNTMCSVITDTNGTVDKFIGDAVMGLWNVPTPVEHHAVHACQAALLSLQSLEKLNRNWAAVGLPDLGVRIGIHTGKALVGNLGSAERLAFTAVGDNINLGARLESLNKKYGTSILISGEVYEQVKDHFLCRYLDVVVVVGRTTHTHIYELVTFMQGATEKQKNLCLLQARALTCYLGKNFEQATQLFSSLALELPSDISIQLFLQRLAEVQSLESLPQEWTGYLILNDK